MWGNRLEVCLHLTHARTLTYQPYHTAEPRLTSALTSFVLSRLLTRCRMAVSQLVRGHSTTCSRELMRWKARLFSELQIADGIR